MSYYLPSKISKHLLRLSHTYDTTDSSPELKAILNNSGVHVQEGAYHRYDDADGHCVLLFVPLNVLGPISPAKQSKLVAKLLDDLQAICGDVPGEFISDIRFEPEDLDDVNFHKSIRINKNQPLDPEKVKIWEADRIRVFISHRDQYKAEAKELSGYLEPFGFTCFVAHETIEPTKEWRLEIMNGLKTMEILLVFLTDDFEESTWTNQEVGFALGFDKPVVTLKLGQKPPPGFISHLQALKGKIDSLDEAAERLITYLTEATGSKERTQMALVKAFVDSPDWAETGRRFGRLSKVVDKLSDAELAMIVDGFENNDQLHRAEYLTNKYQRLVNFLKLTTNRKFRIVGMKLVDETFEDDFPPF